MSGLACFLFPAKKPRANPWSFVPSALEAEAHTPPTAEALPPVFKPCLTAYDRAFEWHSGSQKFAKADNPQKLHINTQQFFIYQALASLFLLFANVSEAAFQVTGTVIAYSSI